MSDRENYMVENCKAPEERIGEILLGIGCDDNHGRCLVLWLSISNDIELHLVEKHPACHPEKSVSALSISIDKEDGSFIGR